MKTPLLLPAILALLCWHTCAQTADQFVAQGRADLTSQDVPDANAAFAAAVALSPTNQTANAFYAITRLLALPNQPAGSNFLTRLGVPAAGRDLYHWSARPPEDANGLLLAPAGVDADEFTAQARTNVLPVILGAISNLDVITDPAFTIDLASNETSFAAVTVDYGDLKVIQAALYGAACLVNTLNPQNASAQLASLRQLYVSGALTASLLLATYPQLLTYTAPGDLPAAQAAFTNGANTYLTASAFIRNRPPNEVRLFNLDPASPSEGDFRLTLQNLEDSLVLGPQFLSLYPDVSVDLNALFTPGLSWRSLLPVFDGNSILVGTLPDVTFGGLVYGLSEGVVENALSQHIRLLTQGAPPRMAANGAVTLSFTTITGHDYTLFSSADLLNWNPVTNFLAASEASQFTDVPASRAFYRLRDDADRLAFAGSVLDANTKLPIAGARVSDATSTAVTDANGKFFLLTTLPGFSFYFGDFLTFTAPGYFQFQNYYQPANAPRSGLTTGLTIYLTP